MKKKVLMSLVLLIAIGTSAVFAQKAGETVQVSGQTYRVESSSNGRVVLQLVPSLDGNWVISGGGWECSFSGSTGTLTYLDPKSGDALWRDAINKGYYKVGTQFVRNIRSTGNLTWSAQYLQVTINNSNRNVATGTTWANVTYTMSPDGQTFTTNEGGVFNRDPGPRQY
jgi:hypothetical protein